MAEDYGDLCEHDEIKEDCNHCKVSAAVDRLDDMVQRASTPRLATLFQRGKDAGLLKPSQEYTGGA